MRSDFCVETHQFWISFRDYCRRVAPDKLILEAHTLRYWLETRKPISYKMYVFDKHHGFVGVRRKGKDQTAAEVVEDFLSCKTETTSDKKCAVTCGNLNFPFLVFASSCMDAMHRKLITNKTISIYMTGQGWTAKYLQNARGWTKDGIWFRLKTSS